MGLMSVDSHNATMTNVSYENLRILFEPGCYFHPDHISLDYNQLPPPLRPAYNHQLIEKYRLPVLTLSTPMPIIFQHGWFQLPKIAWIIGLLSLDVPKLIRTQPWLFTPEEVALWDKLMINHYKNTHFISHHLTVQPREIMALGTEQVCQLMAFFGQAFHQRVQYVFSQEVMSLAKKSPPFSLPYNLIEKAFRHVIG
ncbi:type III secretion apparatus protein OrgA/MxiK [Serratia quinivorans]|uniref:hypothetical protein n=1 Tax=Serratia quinivorans TaxID=137545 RepID=UPI0021797CB8|nr:hypothetical protein [Serratia quinivorans]CAI1905518.1 type III secretion apparatus protein OrgA/MxiK [Serratia quinivorans]